MILWFWLYNQKIQSSLNFTSIGSVNRIQLQKFMVFSKFQTFTDNSERVSIPKIYSFKCVAIIVIKFKFATQYLPFFRLKHFVCGYIIGINWFKRIWTFFFQRTFIKYIIQFHFISSIESVAFIKYTLEINAKRSKDENGIEKKIYHTHNLCIIKKRFES